MNKPRTVLFRNKVEQSTRIQRLIDELQEIIPGMNRFQQKETRRCSRKLYQIAGYAADELCRQKKCPFIQDCLFLIACAAEQVAQTRNVKTAKEVIAILEEFHKTRTIEY